MATKPLTETQKKAYRKLQSYPMTAFQLDVKEKTLDALVRKGCAIKIVNHVEADAYRRVI